MKKYEKPRIGSSQKAYGLVPAVVAPLALGAASVAVGTVVGRAASGVALAAGTKKLDGVNISSLEAVV